MATMSWPGAAPGAAFGGLGGRGLGGTACDGCGISIYLSIYLSISKIIVYTSRSWLEPVVRPGFAGPFVVCPQRPFKVSLWVLFAKHARDGRACPDIHSFVGSVCRRCRPVALLASHFSQRFISMIADFVTCKVPVKTSLLHQTVLTRDVRLAFAMWPLPSIGFSIIEEELFLPRVICVPGCVSCRRGS